jgi:ferrous iron transport protein B
VIHVHPDPAPGPTRSGDTAAADGSSRPEDPRRLPIVALVGRPNVGKSTFMARASGRFVETSNAPGTTLGAERRRVSAGGREAMLVDLPGTRSLVDRPAGDAPFWDSLLGVGPDAILAVVDAADLGRHLPLVLACRELGLPVVVASNLSDDAERAGILVDVGRLSQLLVAPVHRTVSLTGEGVARAVADAISLADRRIAVRDRSASPRSTAPAAVYPPDVERRLREDVELHAVGHSLGAAAFADAGLADFVAAGAVSPRGAASLRLADVLDPYRWRLAADWGTQVERRHEVGPRRADLLARLATSPWPGLPLFALVTLAVLGTMIVVGGALSAALSSLWLATVTPALTAIVTTLVPVPALAGALLWALDGGLLAMVSVGIPYVLTFYLLLAALEDSGYLTSAAVLLDRVFNVLGLPGRAAIPLLSAAGCNVPAIYGTRVLATRRERLLGAWLVTLTPCSARSAVVIAALAPFAGIGAAVAAFAVVAMVALGAGLAANAIVPGRQPALVLELAPLRRPIPIHVGAKAWARFRSFVLMAAPVMVVGSFVLGLVYETGLWASLAPAIEPITMGWLGLPAVAGIAIVFAFLRKELALQLLVALAIVEFGTGASSVGAIMTPAQLFVFAVVTSISIPCAATLATLIDEFGWRPSVAMSGASIALALGVGGILARTLGIA